AVDVALRRLAALIARVGLLPRLGAVLGFALHATTSRAICTARIAVMRSTWNAATTSAMRSRDDSRSRSGVMRWAICRAVTDPPHAAAWTGARGALPRFP